MNLNEKFKVTDERIDVKDITPQQRIMYFPKTKEVKLKASLRYTNEDEEKDQAIILTASKAAKAYPDVFFNSERISYDPENIQTTIKLTRQQDAFCRRHGTMSGYIKFLIDKAMAEEEKAKK